MRIVVYGVNYRPELTGIGKYTGEMAEWLAANGVEVRVVTAPPYYPEWRAHPGYSAWRYAVEKSSGLRVTRCPLWIPDRPSGAKRLVHLASFAASSLPAVLREGLWKPDVVMVIEPTFFCVPAALATARLCGAKAWLHIHDLEVDAAASLGILPEGAVMDSAVKVESWFMRRFDAVSTISDKMLERIRSKGVEESKTSLLRNWVDVQTIRPLPPEEIEFMRAKMGARAGRLIALYSGNMGEKQGLEIILDAARRFAARELPVDFVLCGAGATLARLKREAEGMPNVRFMNLVPFEELGALLNAADIHLAPQRPEIEDLAMPSKLTGILASGGPLVAAGRPGTELATVVGAAGGVVVPPGDLEALAEAVVRLAAQPETRAAMRLQARDYAVRHMGKEAIMQGLMSQLKRLCPDPASQGANPRDARGVAG